MSPPHGASATGLDRVDISHEAQPLVADVPVESMAEPRFDIPDVYRGRILVHVIHDGAWIPEEFMSDSEGRPVAREAVEADYVRERDWGASLVAERVAARLSLGCFHRVNVARVLMDFGRFPGSTPRHADHLSRFAINYPFSRLLGYRQKRALLERYYDEVSTHFESLLSGVLLKIAIHTYDQHNESGTERPPVSLMTRSVGYQMASEMPWGLFDPLYPDILGEFTADRILRDRISLSLEKAKIAVAHNYPYLLPEGSLEVRYQVWAFFRFLQERFEAEHPETVGQPSFSIVWGMLMDTNLRSSESEMLRSVLHMYRRAPDARRDEIERASEAYDAICRFARARASELLDQYRFAPARPSSLALEVRKDLIHELDADGRPIAVKRELVERIGDTIAMAVATYLREDHAEDAISEAASRHEPWYSPPRD